MQLKKKGVMLTSEINISSVLPATLDTRESAVRLIDMIREATVENNKLELDFTGIIFMSRSFADQFHKGLNTYGYPIDIVIKNADFSIVEMLEAVSRTQKGRKPVDQSYQVLSFNDLNKLKKNNIKKEAFHDEWNCVIKPYIKSRREGGES